MSAVPVNSGLRAITHDRSKDWSHRKTFGGGSPLKLPDRLGRVRLPVEDQQDTNFCTAYATSKAIAYIRNIDASPEWQAAKEGEYTGSPITDGAEPKDAMNSGVVNGAIPKKIAPLSLLKDGADKVADYNNWPSNLDPIGQSYAPSGWYAVADDPLYDVFDDIRIALYKAWTANDQAPVMSFGFWYFEWNYAATHPASQGKMPVPVAAPISRHAYLFIDWVTVDGVPYLVGQLSQGSQFGVDGFCLYDRETVNKAFADMIPQGVGLYIYRSSGGRLQALLSIAWELIYHIQSLKKLLALYGGILIEHYLGL